MNWKVNLLEFEQSKLWDSAIAYMQNVIAENPDDMDAAICMNYLLINLLAEEDFDMEKCDYYMFLSKKYLYESYDKFSNNAEYLFCTGITLVMSEWLYDNTQERRHEMLKKAVDLDKNNILYRWGYCSDTELRNDAKRKKLAMSILNDNKARQFLDSKGAIGRYLLDHMIDAGESNKEKLLWLLDLYFSNQIDTSTLCYACNDDYAGGLEGEAFNQHQEGLFFRLMSLSKIYVESSKQNGYRPNFDFPEAGELHQVALQLREALKDDLAK